MYANEQNVSRRIGIVDSTTLEAECLVRYAEIAVAMITPHTNAELIIKKENMNRFGVLFKSSAALLLTALLTGCGSGDGGGNASLGQGPGPAGPPTSAGLGTGVGGWGRGPAPVPLGTAGNFRILSAGAITNAGPSAVNGDVGVTNAGGASIGLSCAEISGNTYAIDNRGPTPCSVNDAAMLTTAKADGDQAYNDSSARTPDYTDLWDGNIGGRNLGPATYKWTTPVQIASDISLTGGPNDVWIFQLAQGLDVSPGVRIFLNGGAVPQNVFWAPTFDSELGANSQFKGILLPAAAVFMRSGAVLNGSMLAEGVHLEQNTVSP